MVLCMYVVAPVALADLASRGRFATLNQLRVVVDVFNFSKEALKLLKIISSNFRDVWNVMDISVVSCAILSFYFK